MGDPRRGEVGRCIFTTALLADTALPLIALLILATGAQITPVQSPRVLAKAGTVLLGAAGLVYPGTRTSAIAVRFQDYVLPFFSRHLCGPEGCE